MYSDELVVAGKRVSVTGGMGTAVLLAFPSCCWWRRWSDWEPITRKCRSEVSYFRRFFMMTVSVGVAALRRLVR